MSWFLGFRTSIWSTIFQVLELKKILRISEILLGSSLDFWNYSAGRMLVPKIPLLPSSRTKGFKMIYETFLGTFWTSRIIKLIVCWFQKLSTYSSS